MFSQKSHRRSHISVLRIIRQQVPPLSLSSFPMAPTAKLSGQSRQPLGNIINTSDCTRAPTLGARGAAAFAKSGPSRARDDFESRDDDDAEVAGLPSLREQPSSLGFYLSTSNEQNDVENNPVAPPGS